MIYLGVFTFDSLSSFFLLLLFGSCLTSVLFAPVCQMWRSVSCQNVEERRSWEAWIALCHVAAAPQTSPNNCLTLYQVYTIPHMFHP